MFTETPVWHAIARNPKPCFLKMRISIHLSNKITSSPHAGAKAGEFHVRCINFQFPTCIKLTVPLTPLVDIKGGRLSEAEPRPALIPATRFLVFVQLEYINDERWVSLKPGEFLQGAVIRRAGDEFAWLVSTDPPAGIEIIGHCA